MLPGDTILKPQDLTDEIWREYDIPGQPKPYRIENPQTLWVGNTTHRVLDNEGVVHCIQWAVGTILRWKPRDPAVLGSRRTGYDLHKQTYLVDCFWRQTPYY